MAGSPPFPTRQMTILAICRICEPIAFMSIFPYVYFMIEDFFRQDGNPHSTNSVAVYAGMITSAFAFAEFSAGVPWGRLSDRIGRKPVLLTGLAGTALSMLLFGLAPSLPVALLARALGGLLNGNIGVLQTTVAEMITVKEHQPRAYAIMPFVWCLGSILGPTLGGTLAKPHNSWPAMFPADSIWAARPYLLPNVVCTVIVLCGVVVGILFLEETHAEMRHRRDPGLEAGRWLISCFTSGSSTTATRSEKGPVPDDAQWLLSEDSPSYHTESETSSFLDSDSERRVRRVAPAAASAFTRPVIMNIVGYGILAYHTMTFDAMMPILLSSDIPKAAPSLPFKFITGYGLTPQEIGVVLSVQGVYSMFATVFLFPMAVRRLGALGLFRTLALSYPLLYIVTPYMGLLPPSSRMAGVYVLAVWKCTLMTLTYPSNAILLTNSAPSLLVLGTINGVAASTASLSRAFGPTISGMLFSTGVHLGYSILAWWCSALIAAAGGILSLYLTDAAGRMDVEEEPSYADRVVAQPAANAAPAVADIDIGLDESMTATV